MKMRRFISVIAVLSMLFSGAFYPMQPQSADRATASNAVRRRASASNAGALGTPSNARPSATPSNLLIPAAYGLVLDENSIIVYDYDELKQAVGENNSYTTIYLGADITTSAAGVTIPSSKTELILDGRPPGNEEQDPYTLTQYNSTSLNATIRVESGNTATKEVTVRNMTVAGGNYYGIVAVQSQNVLLIHDNIRYTGPQPAYNRGGTTRFVDSSYELVTRGGSATNELAETKHAEFAGTVTVTAAATSNAILNLVDSTSSLTVLPDADVTIDTNYYFVYTNGYAPTVTLGERAGLNLTSRRFGFTYGDQRVSNFVLAEDAELYVNVHTTESYAALRVSKLFQMNAGSSATVIRTGTAGIPLRFTNAGASGEFHQPRRVFLYSSAGVPLRFTGQGTLVIDTAALNAWKTVSWPLADDAEQLPDHIWNKAGDELLSLTGTYNEAANRTLEHNLTAADGVLTPLTAANFNLEKSQLVAFGEIALHPDALNIGSRYLTGETVPEAKLRADYTDGAGRSGHILGTADGTGDYRLPAGTDGLQSGSEVLTVACREQLYIRQRIDVRAEAEKLAFLSVPEKLSFGQLPVPDRQALIRRQGGENFRLQVVDSRSNPSPWRLDAYLEQPFSGITESGASVLERAVIFKRADGSTETLSEVPLPVYYQSGTAGGEFDIEWQEEEGLLLEVTPGNVYSDAEYIARIHWLLVDAP